MIEIPGPAIYVPEVPVPKLAYPSFRLNAVYTTNVVGEAPVFAHSIRANPFCMSTLRQYGVPATVASTTVLLEVVPSSLNRKVTVPATSEFTVTRIVAYCGTHTYCPVNVFAAVVVPFSTLM